MILDETAVRSLLDMIGDKDVAVRYCEEGGIAGYTWVSLAAISIGATVYFQGHDVRIERIEITEHPFTRTEPIVYVYDLSTHKPDSFQCESPTMHLLKKV